MNGKNNRKPVESTTKISNTTLVVITGVTGRLGEAYLKELIKTRGIKCVAFTRREPEKRYPRVEYKFANLLDKTEVNKAVESINLEKISQVILIHPVGMFKFELLGFPEKDKNKDGIDDEVFASNVLTFSHIFSALKEKLKNCEKIKFTACGFGSISDKYQIPFWTSYTKSKDLLRELIKSASSRAKDLKVRGVFVNVSTTNTGNERKLRPFANRKYWLRPEEIVRISLPSILSKRESWNELNIYKPHPDFNPTWFTNHENVLKRWEKQTGIPLIELKLGKN